MTAASPGSQREGAWVVRARCLRVPVLALLAGLLAGAALPGGSLPWLGPVVYVPLFVALHLLARCGLRRFSTWASALACTLLMGVVQAGIVGDWVAEALIRFQAVPPVGAWLLAVGGIGALLGAEAAFFLALPFLLGRSRPCWGLWLVPAWVAAFQAVSPRLLPWSYGLYLESYPWLIQALDGVGPAGLSALAVLPAMVLAAWLCRGDSPDCSRRTLVHATAAVAAVLAVASGYGVWRMAAVSAAEETGTPVRVVAVQPNFSMEAPSDDPLVPGPDRPRSLSALVRQSDAALRAFPQPSDGGVVQTLVLWPESAYPKPFFSLPAVAKSIRRWARARGVHLLLQSASTPSADPRTRRMESYHGLAVHIGPDDREPEVYRKIALLPFGDAIPLAGWWPDFGDRVREAWPRAGRYRAGEAHTVFSVAAGVQVAPMICFDAVEPGVAAGMAREGANLGVVLANLTWFGPTRVSALMEHAVRFRAVETRMPIVLAALTGPSLVMDAAGRVQGRRLPTDVDGTLRVTLRLPAVTSWYAGHAGVLAAIHGLLLAGLLVWRGWGWWRARRPH